MGTQLPSQKRHSLPNFRPMSVVAEPLDGLRCHLHGTEVDLGPGDIRRGPRFTPQRRGTEPPNFGLYIVAKRSPISATAKHLLILFPKMATHRPNENFVSHDKINAGEYCNYSRQKCQQCTFLQRAAMLAASHCKRCTSYGNSVCLSVRLSVPPAVRPSQAGIVSKRRHVAWCSLHCRIAKCI